MNPAPRELCTAYPVFRCHVSSFYELKNIVFPTPHFVLLLAANYFSIDQKEMIDVATDLIKKGNAYLCAWGDGCSNGDTNWDIAAVESESEKKYGFFTMTTWHEDESLEEAIWYSLNVAYVDEHIWDTTSVVLATIENEDWKNQIEQICSKPEEFKLRILEDEKKSQPGSSHNVGKRPSFFQRLFGK